MKSRTVMLMVALAIFLASCVLIVRGRRQPHPDAEASSPPADAGSAMQETSTARFPYRMIIKEKPPTNSPDLLMPEDRGMDGVEEVSAMPAEEEAHEAVEEGDASAPHDDEKAIEDELFGRSPKVLSFEDNGKEPGGRLMFGLLQEAIDNVCSGTLPGGKEYNAFEMPPDQTELIRHYMGYFQRLVHRLEVVYGNAPKLEELYRPYSDPIDCFTGIRMTRYHSGGTPTGQEQMYGLYIGQFVPEDAASICVKAGDGQQSVLSGKDHIVYVLLHYICLFYSKSWDTMGMLVAKVNAEKTGASGCSDAAVDGYMYGDIVTSIRPMHFVNGNGRIVRPLIASG